MGASQKKYERNLEHKPSARATHSSSHRTVSSPANVFPSSSIRCLPPDLPSSDPIACIFSPNTICMTTSTRARTVSTEVPPSLSDKLSTSTSGLSTIASHVTDTTLSTTRSTQLVSLSPQPESISGSAASASAQGTHCRPRTDAADCDSRCSAAVARCTTIRRNSASIEDISRLISRSSRRNDAVASSSPCISKTASSTISAPSPSRQTTSSTHPCSPTKPDRYCTISRRCCSSDSLDARCSSDRNGASRGLSHDGPGLAFLRLPLPAAPSGSKDVLSGFRSSTSRPQTPRSACRTFWS